MATLQGSDYSLVIQSEPSFRTEPGSAGAILLPFEQATLGREAKYEDDNSISAHPLPGDRYVEDYFLNGQSLTVKPCLNKMPHLLKALWGEPTTVTLDEATDGQDYNADGDQTDMLYKHTFAMGGEGASILMELNGATDAQRRRLSGMLISTFAWNIMESGSSVTLGMIGGEETTPASAWDSTPTAVALARAIPGNASITTTSGETLGSITSGSFQIDANLEGFPLVDGQQGYGKIARATGQTFQSVSGSVTLLRETGDSVYDLARAGTPIDLTLASRSVGGNETFKLILPRVTFDEPQTNVAGSGSIVETLNWRTSRDDSNLSAVPTIEIINTIASY